MITLTLAQAAAAVGAIAPTEPDPRTVEVRRVVFDSRVAGPRDLFVALDGEHADGHDFVVAALAGGACAAVVHDTSRWPDGDLPLLVVPNTLRALGALAGAVVALAPGVTVVAITGSNGKTTTKEMLAALLAADAPTVATEGNLNNEIGVPVTALRVEPDTRFLVVEMGARKVGDIDHLAGLVHPQIGVVLNVGTAHIGEFGSRAAIAAAKGELVAALAADGLAVLNADDDLVMAMAARTIAPVRSFGRAENADVRAENVTTDARGRAGFDLVAGTGRARVQLGYVGEHHVSNALAAAAVVLTLKSPMTSDDVATVAAALSRQVPVARWRMHVTDRNDGVTIVNDAYNSSPDSAAAAVRALVRIGRGRRTVAVLGEMLELGGASTAEHQRLGRLAVQSGVDVILTVGAGASPIHDGALAQGAVAVAAADRTHDAAPSAANETRATKVADRDAAADELRALVRPGDVVLVKSSRDAGLRWLGDELAGEGTTGGAEVTTT
ncbi:MAG TPA: UDP-N-acetylmuramoyl-tripeptide--D-alanyl-D-alanine ligase [Actinopolymorphaceae bacterium]|jgi:UDP-N-acetylmuramoyl-tripeptide--D-alanyl-D-alanine ligase